MFAVGFSSRKASITMYLQGVHQANGEWPAALGKFKAAKGCLYIDRLGDVDIKVLEKLVAQSMAYVKGKHP